MPEPFFFIPSRGMLDPGEECTMKVTFQPEMALVYDVLATCTFGDHQEQKTLKLKAVGKNIYTLKLSNTKFDMYLQQTFSLLGAPLIFLTSESETNLQLDMLNTVFFRL